MATIGRVVALPLAAVFTQAQIEILPVICQIGAIAAINEIINTVKTVCLIGFAKSIACKCSTIYSSVIGVGAFVIGIAIERIKGYQAVSWEVAGFFRS
ncbi:MAG: hypothetical protein HC912_06545 [Saprospiraceae bacterium]|nr:hypothetical protein [Saprospiraceae bacterium]